MPHIIVEHSAAIADNTDMEKLCRSLFEATNATGVFPKPEDIKVRTAPTNHWYQDVENSSFVHVTVRLLSGRTTEQMQAVTNSILVALVAQLPDVPNITVDIKEINRDTYAKRTA